MIPKLLVNKYVKIKCWNFYFWFFKICNLFNIKSGLLSWFLYFKMFSINRYNETLKLIHFNIKSLKMMLMQTEILCLQILSTLVWFLIYVISRLWWILWKSLWTKSYFLNVNLFWDPGHQYVVMCNIGCVKMYCNCDVDISVQNGKWMQQWIYLIFFKKP